MSKISKHISFDEATKSITAIRRGIHNVPSAEILANMKLVADIRLSVRYEQTA